MTPMQINREQFTKLLTEEKPVLVDYWAPWCGHCRRLEPAYRQIAGDYAGTVTVAALNIDEEEELARQERIEVIPTLVLYRGGKAVASLVAPASKAMIDSFLKTNLQS